MKLRILIVALFAMALFLKAEKVYKPYILTAESSKSISELTPDITAALLANKFTVEGTYSPANDNMRKVIIVSHPELTKAVQKIGGLSGFASTLRVGLITENGKTHVSYTEPEYWCRAYFTEKYSSVEILVKNVTVAFKASFKKLDGAMYVAFGCEDGLDADDLEDYNYMMGMPKFDDTEELAKYDSQTEALKTIEANFKKGVTGVKKVYSYKVPGKNIVLYGVALTGTNGEEKFVPKIDIGQEKHVPFLPYEFLVVDGKVLMLHGRFRIALSFPDLTMGTFSKIMSTPGEIEDQIKSAVVN